MNTLVFKRTAQGLVAVAILLGLGAGGGVWWSKRQTAHAPVTAPATKSERRVLYWYDPMVPQQHFDKPGKSPFMDMELVPKYADEAGDAAGVKIDPAVAQNLGVRLAEVTRGKLDSRIAATGVIAYNERDVSIVQARNGGYVERVAHLAPNDVIKPGAFLAELLVPDWAAVQQEYLALKTLNEAGLVAAARERMQLSGMPEALVRAVETSGQVRNHLAITAPIGGVILELGVRPGMTLAAGQTLARINGIQTVWLDVAVPEAQAGNVKMGQRLEVRLAAFPGKTFDGRVNTVLPGLNEATRSLRVRVELANPGGWLKPGMTAEVSLASGDGARVLRVPTEAVIRTGKRAYVMLAVGEGRYRPVEVTLGQEMGDDTAILSGLEAGQKVAASGQFLIDSEASLRGLLARTASDAKPAPALHEADATIDAISGKEVTLTHGPFKTLNMPGMTMDFPLAHPELARGLKAGDRVRVGVRETDDGLVVEKLEKTEGAK